MTELEAKQRIAARIKPFFPAASLFVFKREAAAKGLKTVVFAARVPKDDAIGGGLADSLMRESIAGDINFPESLDFVESSIDMNEIEFEYFFIRATLWTEN